MLSAKPVSRFTSIIETGLVINFGGAKRYVKKYLMTVDHA
jgi:hypothetical protein